MTSLNKPNGSDLELSKTLLANVPQENHTQFLNDLIATLRFDDQPTIDVITSMVVASGNADATGSLLNFLLRAIQTGKQTAATSTCANHPELATVLLDRVSELLRSDETAKTDSIIDEKSQQHYLRFCKSILPFVFNAPKSLSNIFQASLDLMVSPQRAISFSARDVVFRILSSSEKAIRENIVQPSATIIWDQIRGLCESINRDSSSLGYSLWLRWLSIGIEDVFMHVNEQEYWQLLLNGLRRGDNERRKSCLVILKLSTLEQPSISKDLQKQYSRFGTVFETIVLGRYINQIHECEQDLNFLASTESQIPQKWLYILLGSAIDPQMQVSNRKFIGAWFMDAGLSLSPLFFDFIKHDFLPWAVQGQLFVTSLKSDRGALRCQHGDRLSDMIRNIARSIQTFGLDGVSASTIMAEIIVDSISRKRNSMFVYAIVYLVHGIGEWLTPDQRITIKTISLSRLPEVARNSIRTILNIDSTTQEKSEVRSQRQMLEKTAIKKLETLAPDLASLTDLWGNIEYLEFPKELLMATPHAIFQKPMIDAAVSDSALAISLADKLAVLQRLADTRIFLLANLMTAVRKALIHCPGAFEFLKLDGLIVRMASHRPEPTVDLLLEESTINLAGFKYETYFGDRPSYGFAAYLDIVSSVGDHQNSVKAIIDQLLQPWKNQKVPPPTVSHWKTSLQLQVILLCCEQLQQSKSEAELLLKDLFQVLAIEPLPRYRYLLEWMCTRLCMKHGMQSIILEGLATKDHHSNPKFVASLMKVGCILGCSQESSEDFAFQLAALFVPLAASSKVVIRHEAQWQVPVLIDHARLQGWKSITDNAALSSLDDYIRSLERFDDPPPERLLGKFDPINDHTMTNLIEGAWFNLDHTESPLTIRKDFLRLYQSDTSSQSVKQDTLSCIPLGNEISHNHPTTTNNVNLPILSNPTPKPPGPRSLEESIALQTKGAAYLARALTDPSSTSTRPRNTIVVASLIENPYNLGGLSRVSEIFGAAALTLQNQNVLGNRDFTSVSVSSHLHIPLVQLSASGIPAWLSERKDEGFTVVGIEQTDRSVMLGSKEAVLPEKVVLVVGSEREGIPAVVLSECEVLVEIPQVGVTRSLNVQTAVAIVLFEHARQYPGTS